MNARKGFTIIELLIAASILSLLSTIVLGPLSEARATARDTERKVELRMISAALKLYYQEHGTYAVSGGGYYGGGNGWVGYEVNPSYPVAVTRVLYDLGYITEPLVEDPLQDPGYMLYVCDGGGSFALSATLEDPSDEDIAFIQTTCNGVGDNGTYTRYGKNFAISS